MKTLLLVAGRSQRVKPIEDKNLLFFCGKPLIQHQVEALVEAGLNDILVVGGKHNLNALNEFVKKFLSKRKELKIKVIEQEDLKAGMAGAVLAAEWAISPKDSLFIVSGNDVVDGEAYRLVFDAAQNESFSGFLLGKRVKSYFPGGYLKTDKRGQIQSIVEKPGAKKEPSDLVNLVLHFHRNAGELHKYLKAIKSTRDDRYEKALDQMIKDGAKMQVVPYEGYWQAIKYPWHILEVARHFFEITPKHISASAKIDKKANITGDVVIEDGAKVLAGATIVGPAYIGKNSVVATNALVRESFIGENCVIGFSTEVARSWLGNEVWTHSNYLGDSVIGNNVSFGAGAVTGNLRFDEGNIKVVIGDEKIDSGTNKLGLITGNNIRVGINASFMPGVKIGSNSLVGAGFVINQDIPEGSYVAGELKLKIIPNKNKALPSRSPVALANRHAA